MTQSLQLSTDHIELYLHYAKENGLPLSCVSKTMEEQRQVSHLSNIIGNMVKHSQDETVGLLASPTKLGTFQMMCYSVLSCSSFGHAIRRIAQFYNLLANDLTLGVKESASSVEITVSFTSTTDTASAVVRCDALLVPLYRFLCWLIAEHFPLLMVDLNFPEPSHADEYVQLFQTKKIAFNASSSKLVFPSRYLSFHLAQTECSLRDFLKEAPLNFFVPSSTRYTSYTLKLEVLLRSNIGNFPSMEQAATYLSMHPQSLRRRLHEEGETYTTIKLRTKMNIATQSIRAGLSIEDIAHKTGFSDASCFSRAFKLWTGSTPAVYKKIIRKFDAPTALHNNMA